MVELGIVEWVQVGVMYHKYYLPCLSVVGEEHQQRRKMVKKTNNGGMGGYFS